MPLESGVWTPDEALTGHDFSYRLAKWIGEYFPKNEPLVDVGCGPATYLRYLHDIGFKDLQGIEGTEQNFEYGSVVLLDMVEDRPTIAEVVREPNRSHNVICLEVGEHLPSYFLMAFLNDLTELAGNGKIILSWAVPGQDGIGHVSCRHNIWVIDQMQKRGMTLLVDDTLTVRTVVEDRLSYFRNTLMVFQRAIPKP